MGSPGGFSASLELDELLNIADRGSGLVSVAQRQANAQFNLGLNGTTAAQVAGTVKASSAVVVDANKDISTFRNLRSANVFRTTTAASVSTAGNVTITAAQIVGGILVRDPNGAARSDTLDTAANIVAAVPGAAVGDTLSVLIVNGADAAETITLGAGAGGAFDANQTAASRVIPQNASKLVMIRLTNVTPAAEAYVVYA